MKLIVCLDDYGGMTFNNRRQSKDRVLRADLIQLTANAKLWFNSYTARQFESLPTNACVDDNFLTLAQSGDYCFVENCSVNAYCDRIEQIIIYKWNRYYPSDTYFTVDLKQYEMISNYEFEGYSHENITREVYNKK